MDWSDNKNAVNAMDKMELTEENNQNIEKLTLETFDVNCLLTVCEYLDADSLMNLCQANKYFHNCVCQYKHMLGKKMFLMLEYEEFLPKFIKFGQYIRKIDIGCYSIFPDKKNKFNCFLQAIIDHLVPGNLEELIINFEMKTIDHLFLQNAIPYLCNLKLFSMSQCYCSNEQNYDNQDIVLDSIIGNATKLETLKIYSINTSCDWLRFDHLLNLRQFNFRFCELTKFSSLRQYIERQPKLKSLVFSSVSIHHEHICRLVSHHMPNLEEFEITNHYLELPHGEDFDYGDKSFIEENLGLVSEESESDDSFSIDDFDDSDDNNDRELIDIETEDDFYFPNKFNVNDDSLDNWKKVYSGLRNMICLKKLWLKPYFDDCSDLIDILNVLANKNTLEELTIQITTDDHGSNMQSNDNPFSSFRSLKSLRYISPRQEANEFLFKYIPSLPNVTKFIFDADEMSVSVPDTIVKIVELMENLKILVLRMPPKHWDYLLYIKLLEIRKQKFQKSNEMNQLQICISSYYRQKKCLEMLGSQYDEKFIIVKIKSFMSWYVDPV